MKSYSNPFSLLLRLVLIVEMVLGSTIYFPAVALASAQGKAPSAPVLQSGNHAPVAADDVDTTDEATPVTIDVLENDSDVDGDTLTIDSVTDPEHGAVTINGVVPFMDVTYTPNAAYCGPDTFTYTASDGNGGSGTAEVGIVVCADEEVVIRDDTATASEDTAIDISVTLNDTGAVIPLDYIAVYRAVQFSS